MNINNSNYKFTPISYTHIDINNVEYKPQNLEYILQKEGLIVILDFDTLNSRWSCGWRETGYQEIDINKMEIKD